AVIVIVDVAAVAVADTANVKLDVPLPGAAMLVGEKLAVTPAGTPEALSDIALLKPPATAVDTVVAPLLPLATLTDVGDAESVKLGVVVALIVKPTEVACESVPLAPVTVIV